MVPPQPIPTDDLEAVARGLAGGQRQTEVAEMFGWTKFRVRRCLQAMRTDLAKIKGDPRWLETAFHGPVKVALEWLKTHEAHD